MSEQCPPLSDNDFAVAFREGATDEEIEAKLRDLFFWCYIMRNPLGKVCAAGRGTRADCIKSAFELADNHAAYDLPSETIDKSENEVLLLNGAWRLVLWPPRLDRDPPFWLDCDLDQ
jgi:hypothetical protein